MDHTSSMKGTIVKKTLIARIVGVAMALSVGLGITQPAEANTSSPTITTSVAWSATAYDDARTRPTTKIVTGGNGSHVSALAIKLGLKEETVSDALMAVSQRERLAGISLKPGSQAARFNGRGARQAAVSRALADELRIDRHRVSASLTDLQAELKNRA